MGVPVWSSNKGNEDTRIRLISSNLNSDGTIRMISTDQSSDETIRNTSTDLTDDVRIWNTSSNPPSDAVCESVEKSNEWNLSTTKRSKKKL